MLSVGAFEPGASASPYQMLLRRSLLATRSTFAVRSRVYLHHKCFETQLVLDLYHTGLKRMGVCRWGVGCGAWGLRLPIFTADGLVESALAAGHPIA